SGSKCKGGEGAQPRVIHRAYSPDGFQKGIHAAGQLSRDGGREGTGEDPRRLPGGTAQDREEIVRDLRSRGSCPDLSHEEVGGDRAETGETFVVQPDK